MNLTFVSHMIQYLYSCIYHGYENIMEKMWGYFILYGITARMLRCRRQQYRNYGILMIGRGYQD